MDLVCEYEQMYQKQQRFTDLYGQLCEQFERIRKTAEALKLPWEGEANRQYLIRLESDLLKTVKTLDRLFLASEHLKESIAEYQKTEGLIRELIEGLNV